MRILTIDPSGTGTTGICLINDKEIEFNQFSSPFWERHSTFLIQLVKDWRPNLIIYENFNFVNTCGRDMTSLFKLIGFIEVLKYFFSVKILASPVHQIKKIRKQILTKKQSIKNISFKKGRGGGWFYQSQRLSVHQLDAFLLYYNFSYGLF